MEKILEKISRFTPQLSFLLSGCLFLFVAYKAYHISFTCDEAWTYNNYHCFSPTEIMWSPEAFTMANNHILNSLLMNGSRYLFGNSELSLRLPNVIIYIVFLFYARKLCFRLTENGILRIASLIFLLLQPFMTDFFALCRGYGISLAFELMSLCFLYEYIRLKKENKLVIAFLAAAFSVYANFPALNYFLALSCTVSLYLIVSSAQSRAFSWISIVKQLRFPFLISICLGLLIFKPLYYLKTGNQLFYGEPDFHSTIIGLIQDFFYNVNRPLYPNTTIKQFFWFTLLIGGLLSATIFAISQFQQNKKQQLAHSPQIIFYILTLIILFTTAISTILQHILLATPYLSHRTTLLYIPLLHLIFIQSVLLAIQSAKKNHLKHAFILLCLPLIVHFFDVSTLHSVREWNQDEFVKQVMQDIAGQIPEGKTAKVGTSFAAAQAAFFYQQTVYSKKMEPIDYLPEDELQPNCRFYYDRFEGSKLSAPYVMKKRYSFDRALYQLDSALLTK